MSHLLRPRIAFHGRPLIPKSITSNCVRNERRRFSTRNQPSKSTASPQAEEPGWPMKYKVAGGLAVGTILPWLGSYAVANDPGSRRLVSKVSPSLVDWLRKREGGHFYDEDPGRLEYLARAPEWINQPVSIEVRSKNGEVRQLRDVDAQTPFSSVGQLANGEGVNGAEKSGEKLPGWLTDFKVLDPGERGEGEEEGGAKSARGSTSSWEESSLGARSYDDSSSSGSAVPSAPINPAVRRDIATCNIRSWWDIAAIENERARAPAVPAKAGGRGGGLGRGSPAPAKLYESKMTNADQAKVMDGHIEGVIRALEQDKLTGARSVDDVNDEVRNLRRQQKELRRKYRPKFLGLF